MTATDKKRRASALADIYMKIEDAKAEERALLEEAGASGMSKTDLAALKKVAKEMCTDSAKLAKKYAAEEQSEKNVIALSNERYGEVMKVNYMVREHVRGMLRRIKTLAVDKPEHTPAKAPR
jgi:hypothetical protein